MNIKILVSVCVTALLVSGCLTEPSNRLLQEQMNRAEEVRATMDNASIKIFSHDSAVIKATMDVKVAQTDVQRATGLMFQEVLPDNEGMLFLFEPEDKGHIERCFWMKNTPLELSIIFLSEEAEVVSIHHGDSFRLTPLCSGKPAAMVLEMSRHTARDHLISIGDRLSER